MVRIFHSVDPHGSRLVWKKYLRAAVHYAADVIMLCGDLTGKALVPIVKKGENEWYSAPYGKVESYHSRGDVERKKTAFQEKAFYVFETTEEEVAELQKNPRKLDALFLRLMLETLEDWLVMIEEHVPKGVQVIVCPGNDDHTEIDRVIQRHEKVVYPLNKVVDVGGDFQLISCEWVNTTPWDTPRECSEKELRKKLEKEFRRVDGYENVICNFHAPPYNTLLDFAPKLEKDLKPVTHFGSPVMEHVGSKSVSEVILEYQPLLGLHGHIHESSADCRLGRTLCVNPGSDYRSGVLRGYVIEMPSTKSSEIKCWRVQG